MRLFIHEFFCSGAHAGELAANSLAREGLAMLRAVLEDFAQLPDVDSATTLDRRLRHCALASPLAEFADILWAENATHERSLFQKLAAHSDATFVIAPESDQRLADRRKVVESVGGRFLGHSAEAIDLCSDKLRFFEHLRRHRLPTIPTAPLDVSVKEIAYSFPVVVKPRDGAGSQDTFLIPNGREFAKFRETLAPIAGMGTGIAQICEASVSCDASRPLVIVQSAIRRLGDCRTAARGELSKVSHAHRAAVTGRLPDPALGCPAIVQPFVPGRSLSVAAVVDGEKDVVELFPIGEQRLSDDGRFHYRGGRIPARPPIPAEFAELIRETCRSIPGLHGYIGFDLILADDGRRPLIVEANPRLTTAYLGYRAFARENLAARLLQPDAVSGSVQWDAGEIEFTPNGLTGAAGT